MPSIFNRLILTPSILAFRFLHYNIQIIEFSFVLQNVTLVAKYAYNLSGRWGGIWSAPITYKFDSFSSSQTDVKLTKKFDEWTPGSKTIANRMPHIIGGWLTTQTRENEWGTITG